MNIYELLHLIDEDQPIMIKVAPHIESHYIYRHDICRLSNYILNAPITKIFTSDGDEYISVLI